MKFDKRIALRALVLLILVSAVIHVGALIIVSLQTRSIEPLNVFSVLSLDQLFPALATMTGLSFVVLGIAYAFCYVIIAQTQKKK